MGWLICRLAFRFRHVQAFRFRTVSAHRRRSSSWSFCAVRPIIRKNIVSRVVTHFCIGRSTIWIAYFKSSFAHGALQAIITHLRGEPVKQATQHIHRSGMQWKIGKLQSINWWELWSYVFVRRITADHNTPTECHQSNSADEIIPWIGRSGNRHG